MTVDHSGREPCSGERSASLRGAAEAPVMSTHLAIGPSQASPDLALNDSVEELPLVLANGASLR
jgi:hypothetical protein